MTKWSNLPAPEIDCAVTDGEGTYYRKRILDLDEMGKYVRNFSEIRLTPGSYMGFHPHDGEEETYYMLAGTAEYNDNGEIYQIGPGDVTKCYSGQKHGIKNIGDDDVVFIALIVQTD